MICLSNRHSPKYLYLCWFAVLVFFLLMPTTLLAQEIRERDTVSENSNARLAPGAITSATTFGAKGTNQENGVVVTSIVPGSPAQLAGIEVRDTVVTVNGYQVGIVMGVAYDLEREVMVRASKGQPVNLLVKDWRTSNLTNVTVNFNSSGSQVNPAATSVENQLSQVRVWYDQYLQRSPSSSELTAWRESLVRGGLNLQDIQAYLLGSTEFYERFGRNNDVTFIYALFEKTLGRQPNQTELSRLLSNLNQSGPNRVAFVKEFLSGRPTTVAPGTQNLMTKEVTNSLTSYQKQLAPFVSWGFYVEQSSLIFRSTASIKSIEQYQVPGRENRREQKRLAEDVLNNSIRLNELAVQLRDRAERTNKSVREASKLCEEANKLQSLADQLLYQINRLL
jgi:hypothetical protein